MGIRLDPEAVDAQGLPVVSWEEDRNLFAPDGLTPARVVCFIRPDKETGVLMFVSVGSVRHGQFEEARPWELLKSFEKGSAEQLYHSAADRVLLEALASKSKSGAGRLLAADGAQVMLANFADARASIAMHVNCADATPVEVSLLHDRLHREFIGKRLWFVQENCEGEYVWPKDRLFLSCTPSAPPSGSRWLMRMIDLAIAAGLGLIGWLVYEFVLP